MNYNKLPYKEKKRQLKYRFEQTEKQEEKLLKEEIKRSEEEKRSIEKSLMTDKDREFVEAVMALRVENNG